MGPWLVALSMLAACGDQEAEKAPPPPPATPQAAAGPAVAKPRPATPVDAATNERRGIVRALRQEEVRTTLALSSDQVAKLKALGNGSFDISPKQADLVYALLTPEQRESVRHQMAKRAGPMVLSLAWVQAELGLSEQQRGKLQAMTTATLAGALQINRKADATPEQKAEDAANLTQAFGTASEALLTPEQKAKLEALRTVPQG